MKQIQVEYWMGSMFESIGIQPHTKFDYSLEKRNEIISKVLDNNLQVMLFQSDDNLIIFIDNGKFRQR